MFVPDSAGTIIPADKTAELLAGKYSAPQIPGPPSGGLSAPAAPQAPGAAFATGYSDAADTASNSSIVNNHNNGNIGTAHFNIYESRNPRQTVREISNFMKLSSSRFSPANNT